MKTKNVRFLLLATLLIGVIAEGATAKTAVPKVLILNAYHQGEDWSDNQLNGILPALKKVSPFLVPSIEYLDTKRFPGEGHLEFFKDYLKNKYQGRDFDLIIALDNSALHLMVQYSDELFPDTPIIFAGVNGYHTGMLKGRDKITGVAEVYDIIGTLELILKLHPETKTIFAVHDYTSSGLAVRREMDEECRYTFVSDRIKLILGYDPAEIMNKTLFDLMPREEAIRVEETYRELAAKKQPIVVMENWNLNKAGERICLLTNGLPVLDDEGKLLGYRGVDKDITDLKSNC